jgi:adenosylmethionine-8-amino-7-oxononanoate aminotransferase
MNQSSTIDFQRRDAAHHIHAFLDQKQLNAHGARVIVRGEGVYVWDNDGNQFLDGMSGLWCTAVGYGRQELVDAAAAQLQQLSYYNMFFHTTHPAVVELSDKLFSLLDKRYSHVVYVNSGSEANELLIRSVRRYWDIEGKPDKKIFIGRKNGYHGSTTGSASLGGMDFMHKMGDLPIAGIEHIDEPYWFGKGGALDEDAFGLKAAQELETKILTLGADKVAAFVAEPFQGAGGMIFPPKTYWPEIQRICRKYDVLLCADEVIGGFGRVGEWFAHQYFGFEPDTISIAKGLTSGYIPMGGLIFSRRLAEPLVERGGVFAHGLTYSGHPVAAAVALANLKILENGVVDQVRDDVGPYLQSSLRQRFAEHPIVGDIQGAGMVAALQLSSDPKTRARFEKEDDLAWRCRTIGFEKGVIIRSTIGRVITAPPLVSSRTHVDELVDKIGQAVDAAAREIGYL